VKRRSLAGLSSRPRSSEAKVQSGNKSFHETWTKLNRIIDRNVSNIRKKSSMAGVN